MKRGFIATLLVAIMLATTSTGCIGRMALAGKVGKFNLEVAEGKWGREMVFLLLYIIPVYPIAGAIDLLIVNSIEFWSGTNPISGQERLARAGETRVVKSEDGSVTTMTLRADDSIDLEVITPDGDIHRLNMIRENGHVVARDAENKPIARVDAQGRVVPTGI